jgi:hypothetical protein
MRARERHNLDWRRCQARTAGGPPSRIPVVSGRVAGGVEIKNGSAPSPSAISTPSHGSGCIPSTARTRTASSPSRSPSSDGCSATGAPRTLRLGLAGFVVAPAHPRTPSTRCPQNIAWAGMASATIAARTSRSGTDPRPPGSGHLPATRPAACRPPPSHSVTASTTSSTGRPGGDTTKPEPAPATTPDKQPKTMITNCRTRTVFSTK